MKIAFVGKGGSGKTTMSSLLMRYLASQNRSVIAIDADINQHLSDALGLTDTLPPLGLEIKRIKNYLKGTNPLISSVKAMAKTTPPGTGSRLIRYTESNPIFDYFVRERNGIKLMATGPFTEEDLGVACYHSKTGAVELLLNHLIDKEDDYVVVDMTAGADSFASGLFTRFDITFLVVEPTLKSVSVYKQYKQYAKDFDVQIKVIGNKIENSEDEVFIKEHVNEDYLTSFGHSPYVKALEKGQILPITQVEEENKQVLEIIVDAVNSCSKNWQKFYDQMVFFHKRNAVEWANAQLGEDLTKQIDPDFSFNNFI